MAWDGMDMGHGLDMDGGIQRRRSIERDCLPFDGTHTRQTLSICSSDCQTARTWASGALDDLMSLVKRITGCLKWSRVRLEPRDPQRKYVQLLSSDAGRAT